MLRPSGVRVDVSDTGVLRPTVEPVGRLWSGGSDIDGEDVCTVRVVTVVFSPCMASVADERREEEWPLIMPF